MFRLLMIITLTMSVMFSQGRQNQQRQNAKELIQKTIQFLEVNMPDKAKSLNELKAKNPKRYRRVLTNLAKRYRIIEKLKSSNSDSYQFAIENYKNEITIQELKEDYKESDSEEEKSKIKENIKRLLIKSFDAKMKITENELERMEEKLKESKLKLENQMKNKDKAIELRLEQMLNEDIQW